MVLKSGTSSEVYASVKLEVAGTICSTLLRVVGKPNVSEDNADNCIEKKVMERLLAGRNAPIEQEAVVSQESESMRKRKSPRSTVR